MTEPNITIINVIKKLKKSESRNKSHNFHKELELETLYQSVQPTLTFHKRLACLS